MSKDILRVGLLGFGVVGSGTVKTLLQNKELIHKRAGREIRLVAVADIDLESDRGISLESLSGVRLTRKAEEVIGDPQVDVIIETIGGTKVARELVLKALESGKDVVTANKALLAECGEEVFGAALKHGRRIAFEGAVGGGIPLIEALDGPLASSRIDAIWGILNGTCNYILTKMERGAGDFQAVLKEAQKLGYAERDPTLDVEGFDTAHKMAVLASMCFGQKIDYKKISVEGVTRIEEIDLWFAAHSGYQIKLLGVARRGKKDVDVRVHPAFVSQECVLADVSDVFNAVYLVGDPVGSIMLYGRGAGSLPTGSAVVSDLIQLARGENATPERYEAFCRAGLRLKSADSVEQHFYLRCPVSKTASALNEVISVLTEKGIAVDMVDRVEAEDEANVLLLTGKALRRTINKALSALESAKCAKGKPYAIAIEQVGE